LSSSENAILEFDIIIDAKLSADTEKEIEKLKELKSLQEETGKAETTEEEAVAKGEKEDETLTEFGDTIEGEKFLRNPQAYIFDKVKEELGDQFENVLKIAGPVALAILAAKLAPMIIQQLSVKGGPLNRDWKRFIADEVEVGLSRVQQKEKELGVSQVILTQVVGFHPNNENWTFNSLFDRGSTRLARIGLSDREAGVTMIRG